jgi:hypothetical protein
MTLTTPAGAAPAADLRRSGRGLLVFQRYGDEYFLNRVWTPSSREGLALPESVRQKELAARVTAGERTTIAARK